MAGIGPIKISPGDVLRRKGLRQGIIAPKNELEIFCSLCVGSVYYHEGRRMLYFVDSPELSISDIIKQVYKGLKQTAVIRQLYMDEHNILTAARCIEINSRQKMALFAAFNLSGIHFTTPGGVSK